MLFVRRSADHLIDSDLMSQLLARSDVIVAPSQEYCDYVRTEYPSSGQRVIAILTRLTSDAELRQRLGRAAAARAESLFDWRDWASRYVDTAYKGRAARSVPRRHITPLEPAAVRA